MAKPPTQEAPEGDAGHAPIAMTVQTANALVTGAPAADEQLQAARIHFAGLEAALSISGPRFANARGQAADLHNMAVRRLKEAAHERRARAARAVEVESGLVEIEV